MIISYLRKTFKNERQLRTEINNLIRNQTLQKDIPRKKKNIYIYIWEEIRVDYPKAQQIMNLPASQETLEMWVQFQGWEGPLKEVMAIHSSTLAWRIPWTGYSPWSCKESNMTAAT